MKAHHCCEAGAWVIPSAFLAVLPKCPACVAAYMAAGTGLTLTMSAASSMRVLLIVFCGSVLSILAVRRMRHVLAAFSRA